MAVPLIVLSPPGQGDDWVASELADESEPQLFWDNDVSDWVEEGDLSTDWRIPLTDQLDGRYLNNKAGLGSPGHVTHTARNLLTDGAVGVETLNIVGGNSVPVITGPPELAGPPFIVEAARVFGDRNLRGTLSQVAERTFQGTVVSGASATILMRVLSCGGDPIGVDALANVFVATYLVNDDDPSYRQLVESHFADLATDYFAGLQEDYQWAGVDPPNAERRGYNFRHIMPDSPTPFPDAGQRYLVDFTFYPNEGSSFHATFLLWARS